MYVLFGMAIVGAGLIIRNLLKNKLTEWDKFLIVATFVLLLLSAFNSLFVKMNW